MHTPTAIVQIDRQQSLADISLAVKSLGLPVGAVALGIGIVTSMSDWSRFLNAYLIAFMFVLSISVGCLFFVLAAFLTRAGWSVVVRRVAEMISMGVVPLMVLFLPIAILVLMGNHDLYLWNNPKNVEADKLLQHKAGYLSSTWFFIRYVIYAVVLIGLARYFHRTSLKQDETGDPKLTLKMEGNSTWSAYLFAGVVTFTAIDWMMSLAPTWYSTIFGVYYFAGSAVACMAFMIITLMTLQSRGLLKGVVTTEHFHDLAKLMLGFTAFWAYIGFSQFFLIWYANIPEETIFYLLRQGGQDMSLPWSTISIALIFGCFVIPFVLLLNRPIKRSRTPLFLMACFILAMRYLDMYWLIRPNYQPKAGEILGPTFGLPEICCVVGILGVWLGSIVIMASNRRILAIQDPRLAESIAFRNH